MYDFKLEVYSASQEEPISYVTSEVKFVSFDFTAQAELIIADVNGRFTYVKGIESLDSTRLSILSTKMPRFRDVRYLNDTTLVVSISSEGNISFWDLSKLRDFESEMVNIKPMKSVKSKHRLCCLTYNHIKPEAPSDKKKLKRKHKKVSKDERMILKR